MAERAAAASRRLCWSRCRDKVAGVNRAECARLLWGDTQQDSHALLAPHVATHTALDGRLEHLPRRRMNDPSIADLVVVSKIAPVVRRLEVLIAEPCDRLRRQSFAHLRQVHLPNQHSGDDPFSVYAKGYVLGRRRRRLSVECRRREDQRDRQAEQATAIEASMAVFTGVQCYRLDGGSPAGSAVISRNSPSICSSVERS